MAPAIDAPASAAEARALGEQLQAESIKRANLAVRLLEAVDPGSADEATCRASIQGLLLFFIAACDAGQLRGVGGRGVVASSSPPTTTAATADAASKAVYGGWLARQYTAFTDRLFALVSRGAPPAVQAAAVAALLEAARHEDGAARLGGPLAARVVAALCRCRRAAPEALALLMQRYLPHADVSYYAMRAVSKMAAHLGSAAAVAAAEAAEEEEEDSDDDNANAAAATADADNDEDAAAPAADQLRNLFDVLCRLPPMPPSAAARAADASAITKKAPGALLSSSGGGGGGEGEKGGEVPPTSWCGALEAGLATAASDAGASSKARRRRQQQQARVAAAAAKGGKRAAEAGQGAAAPQQQETATAATAVSWACGPARRRAHAAAWLSLLGCSLPRDLLRKALVRAQQRVLPALPDPGRLADFYTSALDAGGLDGMLALNGLFVLVTRHGLEYPRFYPRLYGLIAGEDGVPSLPPAQRARFLSLADAFLSSPAVPAYSAAAFAKRFARLALRSGDPGLSLACLAFVHNLVRRHPSCMVLLHRPLVADDDNGAAAAAAAAAAGGGGGDGDDDAGAAADLTPPPSKKRRGAGGKGSKDSKGSDSKDSSKDSKGSSKRWDVYDEAAEDPADSRAIESSLWEVAALRRHHCPHVAALAHKLAGKDLADRKGTAEMDVAGLLDASAGTLAAEDYGRRLKAAPPAAARSGAETAALTLFGGGVDGAAGDESGGVSFFEGWRLVGEV